MPFTPSDSSVTVQRSAAYYAVAKATNTITYCWLLYLTWLFFTHALDWKFSTGCVVISGAWLILTRIKVDHLLQTYFDVLSRIELQLPAFLGVILSILALASKAYHPYFRLLAAIEIIAWAYMYLLYRRNQSLFIKQGYGPVPRDTWVNPPAELLRAGDLLITSGNIARQLHESVAHAELVLEYPDGTKKLFSSYMEKGTKIHSIESVTSKMNKGYYIGLHLRTPLSEKQKADAVKMAEEMVAANAKWAAEETVKVNKRIDFLPIPASWKERMKKALKPSGYDWFGTFMGRTCNNRWTCIGSALVLYHNLGIRTNPYGTGLLGFGTSIFDPIVPVRFLADPAFQLIKIDEKPAAVVGEKETQ